MIFIIIISLPFNQVFSQDKAVVEKSIFSLQTGLLGFYINNEYGISNKIVLRTEFGLDAGFFGGELRNKNTTILAPVINFEPRWYYNIEKRALNNKIIKNNNANFLTTSISYHPDWFVISNNEFIKVYDQISIIPKWGIKRNISNSNFNYELGIGLGYRYNFLKKYGFTKNTSEAALDLHVRLGYTF